MSISVAFINGRIYTMEGHVTEAVAISGEKIAALGSTSDISKLCDSNTEIIDLKGRCLLPGFNDSHMHLILYGLTFEKIDLRGLASIEDIIGAGRDYIKQEGKQAGEWVAGYGFDQNLFQVKELPLKEDLDEISNEHPIIIDRICGHVGTANTLALKMVGVTKDTVIKGGVIDRDKNGNPTGVLREAALEWFLSCIPNPKVEKLRDIIKRTVEEALALGLTSIQTNDAEAKEHDSALEAYRSLAEQGELKIRIYEEVNATRPEQLKKFLDTEMQKVYRDNYFKIGNIKLFLDGSLGARTARLRQGYSDDSDNKGIFIHTQEETDALVAIAHKAGMQVACHAIGDAAVEQCINAIEKAMKDEPKQLRHRIVHCQIADKGLFERMTKLGIAADIQPPFVASDYTIVGDRIGEERAKKSYAWKTMLDYGLHLGGGSDSPVETFDPLWGIYCAVTRADGRGRPAGGWLPGEKLSVEEAVKLYTIGSAYLAFEEEQKGTIKEGKLADMVVLSEDIFEVKPEDIKNIKVLMTIVGGKIQYTRA
ncbi:MAG TPA: amidohydrolase [Patescibacteria group bacterium]|nr:amidohydrolase [Patescibacteria group bacterium]